MARKVDTKDRARVTRYYIRFALRLFAVVALPSFRVCAFSVFEYLVQKNSPTFETRTLCTNTRGRSGARVKLTRFVFRIIVVDSKLDADRRDGLYGRSARFPRVHRRDHCRLARVSIRRSLVDSLRTVPPGSD